MSHSLVLLYHWLMGLTVSILTCRIATLVKKIFSLIEILSVTCGKIQSGKSHLGDLMTGDFCHLSVTISYLSAHTVGILHCDIKEISFPGSLPVRHGSFHHMWGLF